MSDEELEKVIAPALNALKYVQYDEAVVVGSVLGQLSTEIKRLRNCLNDEPIERKSNNKRVKKVVLKITRNN